MATFGEAFQTLGFGTNRYNPTDLKNNCVFVTIAFLLDMQPEQLVQWIQQRRPTGGGVALPKILDLLTESRNMDDHLNIRSLGENWDRGTTRSSPIDPFMIHRVLNWYGRSSDSIHGRGVGVSYYRRVGPGHCCTVQKTSRSILHPNGLKYMCYQNESAGRDLSRDAEASTIRLVFYFTDGGYWYWYYPFN